VHRFQGRGQPEVRKTVSSIREAAALVKRGKPKSPPKKPRKADPPEPEVPAEPEAVA
jgi:hypothetical protein